MSSIVKVENLTKTYEGGFEALKNVSLEIEEGEILALLGPNGAGKTTLISTICGITHPTSGSITVGGHDVVTGWRGARQLIGLVPQEIRLEPFEIVGNTVRFSRGLFGKRRNDAFIDEVLSDLSLLDKRNARTAELSGGMRRRVLRLWRWVGSATCHRMGLPSQQVSRRLRWRAGLRQVSWRPYSCLAAGRVFNSWPNRRIRWMRCSGAL